MSNKSCSIVFAVASILPEDTTLIEWPVLARNTNQMEGKLSTIDFLVLASLFFKFSVRLSVFTFVPRNSSTAGYTIN